jgi:glycosyltransferase involved in cell wall biosynthesis
MLKIGLISPYIPEKDGIAIYSDNLLNGLSKKRRQLITIGMKGNKTDYTVDFKSFSLKKELEKIIKKEKLSLIHIQYVATLFGKYNLNLNLINALTLPIPVIVTLHEVQYSTKGLKNKILSCIENEIIKKANKVIVHTSNQKKFLEKKYKTNKITHIYQGLNLHSLKRKTNKNIIFFGMISQGKGLKYLIKAMQYLPDYNLTIAGRFVNRKIEKNIKNELKKTKLNNLKIDFGWINELKKEKYYMNSDLVVLPYIWAPYQSAIMQDAISWGLPLVVTDVGALNEIVRQFKLGEIVKVKNPKAIAEGIKIVFKNYDEYKGGITKYRKAANWSIVAEKHFKLYKNTI